MTDMKTKHTPGDWHVGMNPGPIIYGPKGEEIADLRGSFKLLDHDEALANMRLIMAIPRLLATLHNVDSNAAESVEWIRRVIRSAIADAQP